MIGKLLAGGAALALAVPALAVMAAVGVASDASACIGQAVATASTQDLVSGSIPENPTPTLEPTPSPNADPAATGVADPADALDEAQCVPGLGAGAVTVPPGTPVDVATAVRNALAYVGVTSGWHQLCDRLACRAYGYVGSGYPSAIVHWQTMLADGYAHPGDRCPPLGAFVFWNTGRPYGHVSVVVQADPVGCDPNTIQVTSNGVFDTATGNHGGVYLLTFARLDRMQLAGHGYLGWSPPVCAGALLPAGTVHPAPSGR